MSRSNYDKPFYVDVGTSIAAIRCASNHDVVDSLDHNGSKYAIKIVERTCDRMNREFELYAKSKVESTQPTCDWSVKDALNFANTLANHGWTRDANADAASSCIYALCRMLKERGNAAAMREALLKALTALKVCEWEEGTDMDGVKSIISEIESALTAPPRNCDILDWRKAWDLWRADMHPQKPQTYNEAYRGTVSFMDWYMSKSDKEGENYGK